MGRLLKILLLVVAGIVGLAVIASAALFLFFDPNDFRDEISAEVKDATGRELVIEGDLSLSVFPWIAVNIGRTRLGNAEGFSDRPFLSFEEAKLSVRLVPLLFQQAVTIGTASLQAFSLNLEIAANGRNNWDDLMADAPAEDTARSGGPKTLDIAGVRLSNASISFGDARDGTANTISGLALSTSGISAGKPFDLDSEFDFSAKPAGLSGHLRVGAAMQLGEGYEQLSIRDFEVEGLLEGIAAESSKFRFEAPSIDIDMTTERVVMDKMELSILGLEMSADVEPYSYSDLKPKMSVAVRPFSMKNLMKTLGADVPETADPDALKRVSFKAKAVVGEKAVAFRSMTLALDDTKLTGQLRVPLTDEGSYRFDLTADSINVDRYMAPAEAAAADASAAAEDDMEIPVDLIRTLNAKGSLKLDRAYLSGMTFENVVVGVNSANGKLRLNPISADLFEGKYSGDVQIDAAGNKPSISVNEKISAVQLAPLAMAMYEKKNITGTISGGFKLSGSGKNLAAIRRDLDGSMAFTLADGTWQGTDLWYQLRSARALLKREPAPKPRLPARTEFSDVRASGPVKDGIFRNEDLQAKLPFLQLTGNGTVDLAEATIDYSMQARVLEKPEFIDPANEAELADFTEAVIPVRITGPLASPSVKPDIGAMAKAEVKRAVEKKGEELKKRLIGELIGGKEPPPDEVPAEEGGDQARDEDPEDKLEDALKKLFER